MDTNRRVVLITGGAQGLGLEIARHLIRRRHHVVVLDIQKRPYPGRTGGRAEFDYHRVDLVDSRGVTKVINRVLRKYRRIDVLINNAALRLFKRFDEFDSAEIKRLVAVNFESPVMMARHVYPSMKRNAYGRIINISSFSALEGYSLGSMYCGTKSALNVFTGSLAKEMRPDENVTVNAICPGSFSTVEGTAGPDHDYIVRRVMVAIDDIIDTDRNGSIITIARRRHILVNALQTFRRYLMWLLNR